MDERSLACTDASFPKLSHATALAVIEDLGFAGADICVFAGYEHAPPANVIADPHGAAEAVLRRLGATGLVVADVFLILSDRFETLAVNHPEAAVRREAMLQFEQIIRFCQRVRPPGLTILPGTPFEGVRHQASLELAAAELQRRAEIAGEAGLALSIEPHYESIAGTPGATLALLERAPDLRLTLDYSHFVFQGFAQAEIDTLIPHARHVHLRPAAPGDMQTRAGHGTIDFGLLLRRLDAARYRGHLTLEYCWEEWMGLNDADCLSETAVLRALVLAELTQIGNSNKAVGSPVASVRSGRLPNIIRRDSQQEAS